MAAIPGEPKESPKPQPIGNMPIIFLFTACTLCALFILWRRADALRRVVSHSLKTITSRNDGRIRLSEDDGPPAHEFLEDDYDEDNAHLNDSDDEPLSEHVRKATQAWREPNDPEEIRVLDATRTPRWGA
ncbi:uncharacterized protein LACBIDRAFT_299239 [Laccaria bicolor S238N-H82]|uniref:Predicted protein n=1 Tax=Laccaria bicolor (strain S238N-H82 / ATCC MYA-4686) TaxID=486041 RepID=B0DEB7_LACBS|nr:uncharacterized protein LACBIDRAFT_299239 [Laccaria bicolor S238N-H82]EDR07010.1 predicted protein [Laccaria bicolor S238N-H82]|eukprot:XP_001882383.1 predicted protein [Laccaria bicolor S238N-H82]